MRTDLWVASYGKTFKIWNFNFIDFQWNTQKYVLTENQYSRNKHWCVPDDYNYGYEICAKEFLDSNPVQLFP